MFPPPTKTVQTRHGPMKALAGDRFITPCLEVYGEYSRREWLLLDQITKPGMTVIEAGANIGSLTIPLARKCAPAPLFAFEPQREVMALLRENLQLNGIKNVWPILAGCGSQLGEAIVPRVDYAGHHNFGGVSLSTAGDGERVRIQPIDGLALDACGLIKIDVEGAELDTLDGAAQTISRYRPVIYTENAIVEHQQALISKIDGLGYDLFWHAPPLIDAGNFNGVQENIFGQWIISINMLCLPKERATVVRNLEPIDPRNWRSPKGQFSPA